MKNSFILLRKLNHRALKITHNGGAYIVPSYFTHIRLHCIVFLFYWGFNVEWHMLLCYSEQHQKPVCVFMCFNTTVYWANASINVTYYKLRESYSTLRFQTTVFVLVLHQHTWIASPQNMVGANNFHWMTRDVKCWEKRMNAAICLHWTVKQPWQAEKHIEPLSVRGHSEIYLERRFLRTVNLNQSCQWCVSKYQSVHSLNPQTPLYWIHCIQNK